MRTEAPYVTTVVMGAALAAILLVPVGCGPREAAAPAPPPAASLAPATPSASPMPTAEPPQAMPSTVPAASPVSTAASAAAAPVPQPPAGTPSPSPASPTAAPPRPLATAALPPAATTPAAPRASGPQPVPAASGVADPGGEIAVEATRSGLTRVGAAKCGVCHKLQYASWSETAHAKRKPPLDCESCHGAGSEYKSLAVMKDAERAKAAGLVLPDATFCATCHRQGWKDDQLRTVHAHKEPPKP